MAEGSGRMKGFYTLLAAVAVIGGGAMWYRSQRSPALPAPSAPLPVATADAFHGYALGSASAPIEITEYSDFECPFCASFATVQMPVIREQLIATGKLRWRFRDFPLPSHKYSRYAALAAQCAGEQGKFWEMHDQLFTNHQWAQTGKNPRSLFRDFARAIGLDLDRFRTDIESPATKAHLEADRKLADDLGVKGTPTIFINGREYDGKIDMGEWVDGEIAASDRPTAPSWALGSATASWSGPLKPGPKPFARRS